VLAVSAEKGAMWADSDFVGETHYLKLLLVQGTPAKLLFGGFVAGKGEFGGRPGYAEWRFVAFRLVAGAVERLLWLRAPGLGLARLWRR
jgi:hypothetical protein